MSITKFIRLSGVILFSVIFFIAALTSYSLNELEALNTKDRISVEVRNSALDAKFHIVQIQQFLTDASVTGDEEGISEAKTHVQSLQLSLNNIKTNHPQLSDTIDSIITESNSLFNVGKLMANAYINQGKEAGNLIMKRPGTGLDALSDSLSGKMEKLENQVADEQKDAYKQTENTQKNLMIQTIVLSIIQLSVMFGSFYIIGRRMKPLEGVIESLNTNAERLEDISNSVNDSAQSLTSSNSRQSAATHQTAASLEQIRAMVNKTSDNSQFLSKRAQETNESVAEGKRALQEVISTIHAISDSQKDIATSVEQTNNDIGNIVKLVSNIGAKANVINDIVFQTKLLSFNASVEAARAGESGRGFAVVAEEVGTLAQMSGNAAKEITELLDDSIQKIKSIIEDSRNKLNSTMAVNTNKIEEGVTTANLCGESFETIVTQIESVNSTSQQTSSAIDETVKGLNEISKAIHDLDETTTTNSETSVATSKNSEDLMGQLNNLKTAIQEVDRVIKGA